MTQYPIELLLVALLAVTVYTGDEETPSEWDLVLLDMEDELEEMEQGMDIPRSEVISQLGDLNNGEYRLYTYRKPHWLKELVAVVTGREITYKLAYKEPQSELYSGEMTLHLDNSSWSLK